MGLFCSLWMKLKQKPQMKQHLLQDRGDLQTSTDVQLDLQNLQVICVKQTKLCRFKGFSFH